MYCTYCGKELREDVRFCGFCGTPVSIKDSQESQIYRQNATERKIRIDYKKVKSHNSGSLQATSQSQEINTPFTSGVNEKSDASAVREQSNRKKSTHKKRKHKTGFFAIIKAHKLMMGLIALLIVGANVIGYFLFAQESQRSIPISVGSLPELPDALAYYDFDADITTILGSSITRFNGSLENFQMAQDGTIITKEDFGIGIYRNGERIGEIPVLTDQFLLSGDGEKILYQVQGQGDYLWDISSCQSEQVSENNSLDFDRLAYISFNGNVAYPGMTRSGWHNKGILTDGDENELSDLVILNMSPDGKYIYCMNWQKDKSNQKHYCLSIIADGENRIICDFGNERKNARMISCSSDFQSALVEVNGDVYYVCADNSAENGYDAFIMDAAHNGSLLSLDSFYAGCSLCDKKDRVCFIDYCRVIYKQQYNNIEEFQWFRGKALYFSTYLYNANVGTYIRGNCMRDRTVPSVQEEVYCYLKDEQDEEPISLMKITNGQLEEIVSNVTGSDIHISADRSKLWCIADGQLTFCDLSNNGSAVKTCDSISVQKINVDYYPAYYSPLAVTSDGSKVYFVGENHELWMCTPDTVDQPKLIANDILWTWCSADDTLYALQGKSIDSENFTRNFRTNNEFWENGATLYQIDDDGSLTLIHENTIDMIMTKTGTYVIDVKWNNGEAVYSLLQLVNTNLRIIEDEIGGFNFCIDPVYWGVVGVLPDEKDIVPLGNGDLLIMEDSTGNQYTVQSYMEIAELS